MRRRDSSGMCRRATPPVRSSSVPITTMCCAFFEVHHEGEDLLVTPLLAERCTDDEAEVVLRVATQHKEVLGPLEDADEALGSWRFGAEPGETSDAAAALVALGQVLTPHLDEEEQAVLPLAAAHLTLEEWGALPATGCRASPATTCGSSWGSSASR